MSRKPARRAGIQALFASRYRLYLRKELDVLLGRMNAVAERRQARRDQLKACHELEVQIGDTRWPSRRKHSLTAR